MAAFVYSPDYYCDLGTHVFRTEKYGFLRDRLVEEGLVEPDGFLIPEPASRGDLLLVHTEQYLEDLFAARHSRRTGASEMPLTREIAEAFRLGAGGTMLACRTALQRRTFSMNLAGGFHHGFPDWAEGFCFINDVALGVRKVRSEGLVDRVMVVDCDLHQGNGTAVIFQDTPEVFTFSIHEQAIYPVKRQSDLDVGLPGFCDGERYLEELSGHLLPALDEHEPEFVLYVGGADPYAGDQLGSLSLSIDDLRQRDELVLGACAERGIPATATLAGGYAADVADTVRIHLGTARTLISLTDELHQHRPD